jgi:Tfp pilus assembly protein PilF
MNNKNINIQENFNLGLQNFKKNNLKDAENFFKEVLNNNSDHLESIFFLGILYAKKKYFDKAKDFFIKVIQIDSSYIDAYYNLGIVFNELKDFQNSINYYKKAIQIDSNHADAHNNLGLVFYKLKDFQNSINYYKKAIQIDSNNVHAYNNFGNSLIGLYRTKEAVDYYKKAIEIDSNYIKAHENLGIAFYKLGEFQKAINCHEKAIQLDPNNLYSHNNLGILFHQLGQFKNAKSYFEKAMQIDPNHPDVNFSFGMLLLSMSDFKNGLNKYEWRKKLPININTLKSVKGLEWQGENLNNKTILILFEQGIGDIIQFSRYIYLIEKEYSANIIIKTDKKFAHLFSKSKFKLIFNEDNIPKYDFYKHLMSFPKIYYEKTKTFPSQINFIPKDKKIILKWKERLNEIKGFKVGINWQGRKTYGADHLRSIPLNYFNDLFSIEKINFISLQKGFGLEQIKNFKHKDKLYNFSKEVDNGENIFEDTIGILQNIDLVISIDSSLVHLSSTLGIKTFALLHFCPDWRWNLMTKEFSWYDNLKIYRQEEVNKWDSVFSLLKKDLVASLGNSKHNIN